MSVFQMIASFSLAHKLLLIAVLIGLGLIAWFVSRLNVEMNLFAFKWLSKKELDDADFYVKEIKESLKQIDPTATKKLRHDLAFQRMIAQYKRRHLAPDEKTKYLREIVEYIHKQIGKTPKK